MPLPPKDPKAAFAEITRRREAELALQKAKYESDAEVAKERSAAEQQAYLVEQEQAKTRSGEREEWRQEQHGKRREDEELRRRLEVERLAEEERKKKLQEAQNKRDAQMADLHRKAVEKKVAEKIAGAKTEEGKRKHDATNYEERSLTSLDADADRRITHLQRDADMRKKSLQIDAQRTKAEAEETYKVTKKEAESSSYNALRDAKTEQDKRDIRMEESQAVARAHAQRSRALFALDESLAQKLFDIDTETKRLIDEVKRDFAAKKQIATRDADRKRMDAQAQREGVEKWFGRDNTKKDSKDPLS